MLGRLAAEIERLWPDAVASLHAYPTNRRLREAAPRRGSRCIFTTLELGVSAQGRGWVVAIRV